MDIDIQVCGRPVPVSVIAPDPATDRHCAVLYYHGGGFLCGEMGDLPRLYQRMFTQAGYTLVTVEYPLCPEYTLAGSVAYSLEALGELVREGLPQLGCTSYVLFGRSAGAYLVLKLAASLRCGAPELLQPAAILDFYGFWNLDEAFLNEPVAHYQAMPHVDEQTVATICGEEGELVLGGGNAQRFSVYLYARQPGGARGLRGRTRLPLQPPGALKHPHQKGSSSCVSHCSSRSAYPPRPSTSWPLPCARLATSLPTSTPRPPMQPNSLAAAPEPRSS